MTTDPARHYDRITEAWSIILGDDLHHGLFAPGETDLATATGTPDRAMAATAAPPPGRIGSSTWGAAPGPRPAGWPRAIGAARVVGVSTSAVGVAARRRRSRGRRPERYRHLRGGRCTASGLEGGAWDVVWLLESSQYLARAAS